MKHNIITIGGATEDITFYTDGGVLIDNKKDILRQKLLAFEYGAKIKVDRAHASFGGGAANAAVSFSRLGLKATVLVAVGNDERGRRIINNLKKQGVEVKRIQKIKNTESGFSFLLVGPSNEHIVFSNRAANSQLKIFPKEKKLLKKVDWVYLTSLSGNWLDALKQIFSVPGIKVAWNPGHVQLKGGIRQVGKFLKKTAVLLVNKDEAIELVVSSPKFKNKPRAWILQSKNLLTALKTYGPRIVVITNGRHGADVYNGYKFFHAEIVKEKKRIDTTGVGDAFNSSFIAGLELFSGDINRAIKLGLKNSASVIAKQGAQNGLLRRQDI